ncbi:hypothetical protein PENVUL_c004G08974 [Penicillium vulpinum]|uniref:Mid2 domain-containing protein n=2 Tax=Penicillium vulpinum TaxID=29845 RepID=A0A1V6S906_9EURO|nr:hypothetical protein PENVUL_c004G08974 [Penicillium vulpinum]
MLPLYALFLIPLVDAWTFRTTNATGATEISRGEEEQQCTNATIGNGKLFTWDPEGSKLCVSIYRDTDCDSRAGYSCTLWRKNASDEFLAFDVLLEGEIEAKHKTSTLAVTSTSTSATESTPTSTSTSTSKSSSSSTSTPASTSASTSSTVSPASASATPTESTAVSVGNANNSSLSGGAIAGIVVGVVAAVAIVVAFIFVFLRKKNKKNTAVSNQHGGYGPLEVDATGSSRSGTMVAENASNPIVEKEADSVHPFRSSPRSHVVELIGDGGSAELGSHQISEMDGTSANRTFN